VISCVIWSPDVAFGSSTDLLYTYAIEERRAAETDQTVLLREFAAEDICSMMPIS